MSGFQGTFERKEVKYILSAAQYEELMKRLLTIAVVDEYGESPIYNIYFDTPDFKLIRRSLEKPVYKEKLRLRTYGIPGDQTNAFVEIKKKYKGIVYKRRISMTYQEAIDYMIYGKPSPVRSQISDEIDYFLLGYRELIPAMAISYDRIAMKGIDDPNLRITFDRNLRWSIQDLDLRNGNHGQEILEEGQRLMEVKIQGAMRMDMAKWFSELGIFPVSVSKYGKGYLELLEEELAAGKPYALQAQEAAERAGRVFRRGFRTYTEAVHTNEELVRSGRHSALKLA